MFALVIFLLHTVEALGYLGILLGFWMLIASGPRKVVDRNACSPDN